MPREGARRKDHLNAVVGKKVNQMQAMKRGSPEHIKAVKEGMAYIRQWEKEEASISRQDQDEIKRVLSARSQKLQKTSKGGILTGAMKNVRKNLALLGGKPVAAEPKAKNFKEAIKIGRRSSNIEDRRRDPEGVAGKVTRPKPRSKK